MGSRTRRLIALLMAGLIAIIGLPTLAGASGEPPTPNDDEAIYDLNFVTDPSNPPSIVIDVLSNDSDPEGDPLEIAPFSTASELGGVISCTKYECSYTPPVPVPVAGTTESFVYSVLDGESGSGAIATITFTGDPVAGECVDPTAGLNDSEIVTGYEWLACTGSTSNELVNNFSPLLPTTGASTLMMTNGTVEAAKPPNDSTGSTGSVEASNTYHGANDVQTLRVDLNVPAGMSCLAFDFVFGSEEYPEFVDSDFNDGFLAELDQHTWMVNGEVITAPDNFAFDSGGDLVSINSTFFAPERVVTETGMQYDGSTPRLRAQTPVTPGNHSLYLSVFDASDTILDSGVLIDNLRVTSVSAADCGKGAVVEIAVDDVWNGFEDNPAMGNVLMNDLLAATATPTVLVATQPANGTATCSTSGLCVYTPNANFNGVDSFTYLVEDGLGANDNGTVTINVGPTNDAPTAVDDTITTEEGTTGSVNVLDNDSDIDGDPLQIMGWAQGENGSVSCTTAGVCTYTPNPGFTGSDSFTYTSTDGNGATGHATVRVTVSAGPPPVNTPPVANDDTASSADGAVANVNVLANDTDADGDTLTVSASTNGTNGTVTCTGPGECSYTPNAGFTGTDSFTYTVSDGNGGTDTATVTVTVTQTPPPANNPPVANDDNGSSADGAVANVSVLANDTDADGDTLTVTGSTQPANGTVTCTSSVCSYTPNAGFTGTDSFTYTVSDGNGGTDTATVTITVTQTPPPTNNPPVANDDNEASADGAVANVSVLANDTDADGDTLTVTGSTQPANGTVTCTSSLCTYTPNAGFEGTDTFTYTISDGNGGTDTATVTVTVTQTPPPPSCSLDEVDIVLTGGHTGAYSGCVSSGDLKVIRDDFGIVSVKGTITVPSLKGGDGTATIKVEVERLWILPLYLGKTKIKDTSAGINSSAYLILGSVTGSANQAHAGFSGLAGKWWNFNFFHLSLGITNDR